MDREQLRQDHLARTPRWYRGWLHLAGTTSVGVAAVIAAARWMPAARASDVEVVPAALLLANFGEWRIHKKLLHRRWRAFPLPYDIHTAMHHVIYVEDDMALRESREMRLVLMPLSGVVALALGTAPLAWVVGWAWSACAGWLFFVTAILSLVAYELLHFSYHLPAESFVGRLRVIRALRAHHARHHDPELMGRYNFNVTVPLFDWLLGTCWRS